jgi:hypothetical protein
MAASTCGQAFIPRSIVYDFVVTGACLSTSLLTRTESPRHDGRRAPGTVVEQDHLPVASQAIRHGWVPVIHGAEVVLVEDERHSSGLARSGDTRSGCR